MSLAQKYRLQFAAQRGDRLMLCLAAAVAFHLGLVTAGLALWQQVTTAEMEAAIEAESSIPIEFVYLETPGAKPPAETTRQAAIESTAGGDYKAELPPNAGKPGGKEAIGAIAPPQPSKPFETAAQPPAGTIVPTSANPKAANPESVNKAPTPAPSAIAAPPQMATEVPPSLPVLQAADPTIPADPVPSPSTETTPSTAIDTALSPLPSATAPVTDEVFTPPLQAGTGLDGITNPNRSTTAEAGLDAEQDLVLGAYQQALTREVAEHWRQISPNGIDETKVRFRINRLGEVVDLTLIQSSNSDVADQAAFQAVLEAAPFAPIPPEIVDNSIVVNFTFTHRASRVP